MDGLDAFLAPWTDHPAQLRELRLAIRELRHMAQITQADLDNLAAELVSDTGAIQTQIDALKSANPDLDLSGLQNAVAEVGKLVPSETGGGEGPVATDPGTPVVAGDGTDQPA
jgi:hypothetical protein